MEHLLHHSVDLASFLGCLCERDPFAESLFLAHKDSVSQHLLQEEKFGLSRSVPLHRLSCLAAILFFLVEFGQQLPLGEGMLEPAIVVILNCAANVVLALSCFLKMTGRDFLSLKLHVLDPIIQESVPVGVALRGLHVVLTRMHIEVLQRLHHFDVVLYALQLLLKEALLLTNSLDLKSIVEKSVELSVFHAIGFHCAQPFAAFSVKPIFVLSDGRERRDLTPCIVANLVGLNASATMLRLLVGCKCSTIDWVHKVHFLATVRRGLPVLLIFEEFAG